MDPAPALYMIRINGHLGATVLSAFPSLAAQHNGAHTVITGLLDQCSGRSNHRDPVTPPHLTGGNAEIGRPRADFSGRLT